METFLYILAALLIATAVILWHFNRDKIERFFKGGPIIVTDKPSLSSSVDRMHAAKSEALRHAAILEKEIATVRADLTAATNKLVPVAPVPETSP